MREESDLDEEETEEIDELEEEEESGFDEGW